MGLINLIQTEWREDPFDFSSKLASIILTIGNILATQIPYFHTFFIKNNIYLTSTWLVIIFIFYQLLKISQAQKKYFEDNCNLYHSDDIFKVVSKYSQVDEVKIFCGSNNRDIWNKLSNKKKLQFKKVLVFFKFSEIGKFKFPDFNYESIKIKYSEVPSNYLFITGYKDNVCCNSDLIIKGKEDNYSILDLSNSLKHREIYNSLFDSLIQNNSVNIDDYLLITLFEILLKKHNTNIKQLIKQRKIGLENRHDFFRLAINLVNQAKKSLYAIDFIKPNYWLEDKEVNKYAEAHSINAESKKRIHVCDFKNSKNNFSFYLKYIKLMRNYGVEVKFLDEKNFDTNIYEKRGTLIIDSICVIVAINPKEGATFGEIDFNLETINDYKMRFNNINKISLSAEKFLEEIKS